MTDRPCVVERGGGAATTINYVRRRPCVFSVLFCSFFVLVRVPQPALTVSWTGGRGALRHSPLRCCGVRRRRLSSKSTLTFRNATTPHHHSNQPFFRCLFSAVLFLHCCCTINGRCWSFASLFVEFLQLRYDGLLCGVRVHMMRMKKRDAHGRALRVI